jgi:hypothetical protein
MRQYVVGFMYEGEFLYDHLEAESARQATDLFEATMREAGEWWYWDFPNSDRCLKVRTAFISGIEARPTGGRGRWSR